MTSFRQITTNTTYRATAEAASKLISFAFYVVLAREAGDDAFGVFTFGLAVSAIITTLANFGQDAVLTRSIVRDGDAIHRYFANTIALKALLTVPVLGAVLAVATVTETTATTRNVLAILGVGALFEGLLATTFGALLAYERMGLISVAVVVQRVATTLVGVPLLLAGADVVAAAAVYSGGAVVAFFLAATFLNQKVVRPQTRVEPRRWPTLLRDAFPVALTSIFGITLFRADVVILALFASTAAVGEYGAAYRLFETTLFVSWAVTAAVYPSFSRLTEPTTAVLGTMYARALKLVAAPTAPVAVAALALGPGIVSTLYGSEFDATAVALMLLAPAIALYPIEYVSGGMLVAQGRQRTVAIVMGSVAAGNVLINFAVIPWLSLYGAALATTAAELSLAIALVLVARRLTGPVAWARIAAGAAVASVAAGLAMVALRGALPVAVAAGIVTYVAILVAWERRHFPEDARAFVEVFRRASTARR